MSGNVIPMQDVTNLPAHLTNKFGDAAEDLISGSGGFPVISIRGGKWRLKREGDEQPLTNIDGDPVASVDLVIIRAIEGLSKNYYSSDYSEGDDSAPDCTSLDGVTPDSGVLAQQSTSCAACPHNVWGSKITPQGNKTKACSDSKILAVTFSSNLENEELGGVMMLRVPAASLKDLTRFGRGMKEKGFVPQQVAMKVGFDLDVSFPKLTFQAVRAMNAEELEVIGELYDSDQVASIIHTGEQSAAPAQPQQPKAPVVDTNFSGQEDAAPVMAAPAKPKAKAKAKPKAEPAPEPEAAAPSVDADLDNILGDL